MRLIGTTLLCFVLLIACSRGNQSINRVVDSYLDKASINPNWEKGLLSPEWYYRMTVVDTAPNSQAMSVGEGTWLHPETIRFEITEKHLIGYRSKASVPGTDAESDEYKGAPVVVFKITSHFDVARNYDPMTSAQGNLIQENKTDRSWYKRRFMKVDFGRNLAWAWGSKRFEDENSFAIGQNEPSNPKRSRFEDKYFEVTTRQSVRADANAYYGYYGEAFKEDATAPVVDLRFSFMRKPERSNYQPLNYTDNLYDKFGFFRVAISGQQKWDPKRGSLETNKNYNITRFNIWNEDGSPKPIIYYTSVSHPKNLMNASRRIESEWNKIFKELVFEMKKGQYADVSKVPNMWVLKENSCNFDNVNALLAGDMRKQVEEISKLSLSDIKKRLDHANDLSNKATFTQNSQEEAIALDDLEKVCATFEYFTQGTDKAFKYQRSGDLRYNLLNIINKYAMTNWSGFGPMFADMETGEIIQSQSNVNLRYLESRAQQTVDLMEMSLGRLRFKDLVLGGDVKKYMAQKMSQIKRESEWLPNTNAMLRMKEHLRGQEVDDISESDISSRLNTLDGTLLVSKIGNLEFSLLKKEQRMAEQSMGVSEPPEYLDGLVIGLALQYKDEEPRKRFLKVRESAYIATMLHEIGHNQGLMHNMSASADALNYGEQFWKIQSLPSKLLEAVQASKNDQELQNKLVFCLRDTVTVFGKILSTQECLRQQEFMYSSIMDYRAAWNVDLGGLGPYDKAAIFFGYGQLIQVFPEKNLKQKNLERWLFLNDWRKIPKEFVSDYQKINDRQWVSYDANVKLSNEVPYRYCYDSSGTQGPHCRSFDHGADMRGRSAWNQTQYWQHYYLTHFSRDRIWNFSTDFQNIISQDLRILEDYNHIMRWYGYYMLTDPEFKNSDAGKDYLAAVVTGLNHYSHVLGHPVSGEHVTTIEEPNILHPIDEVDSCVIENVVTTNDKNERMAAPGHVYSNVFLGDGRPFVMGLNNDYEDYHMNYVGSFHIKLLAGYYLAYPGGSTFPRVDNMKDPRLFRMNWYRLFPDEVGDLFSKMIRSELSQLGPVLSPEGDLIHRDILDPVTLEKPNYTGHTPILPLSADMLPYRSMFYVAALLSTPQNTEFNLINSMKIGILQRGHQLSSEDMTFENPSDSQIYWAKKAGSSPIAYDYLVKLNDLQKKINTLKQCVSNQELRKKEASCSCVIALKDSNCIKALSSPCSDDDLKKKLEKNMKDLEKAVGFAGDMHRLVERYTRLR